MTFLLYYQLICWIRYTVYWIFKNTLDGNDIRKSKVSFTRFPILKVSNICFIYEIRKFSATPFNSLILRIHNQQNPVYIINYWVFQLHFLKAIKLSSIPAIFNIHFLMLEWILCYVPVYGYLLFCGGNPGLESQEDWGTRHADDWRLHDLSTLFAVK